MRIGIYGGTFDPVHIGHISAALAAMEEMKLDRLLLIPAATPPHKQAGETGTGHRVAMLRLAVENLRRPDVEVSTVEIERGGKSYTADTVQTVLAQYPGAELFLLMGTDMLQSLPDWSRPQEILNSVTICAFGRNGTDSETSLHNIADAIRAQFPGARIHTFVNPNLVEVSSTEVRAALAAGGGETLLDPAVYGYVLREGLYGTEADKKHLPLSLLRPVALSLLNGKRVPHVLGTEETAAKLARLYGADEMLARRAALLHDCTKRLSREEHLALCEQYGISLDEWELNGSKLLHARTGAALASTVFGERAEVVDAIRWHTTGKPDMTLLEKVIYLADYVEPNRNFEGVEEVRTLAWQDLDKAVMRGLAMTVAEIEAEDRPVHPDTKNALAYLKGTRL